MVYDQTKKKYLKKIKLLEKYNKFYFESSRPLVSDKEYDQLKLDILKIEKNFPDLKDQNSPSLKVGFKPSKNFVKAKHRVHMLSLSNAFSEQDLNNFEKKILNFLSLKKTTKLEFSAEPKIDGISASLTYQNGKFVKGLSRGDGFEGEDISENLKTIQDIPLEIVSKNFPSEIDIRGEVFIANSDFKTLRDKFANPRNAASGSLRQKNSSETKKIPLKFIAYTFGYSSNLNVKNQSEFLTSLRKWGFSTSNFNKTISGISNLVLFHKKFEKKRYT